MPETRQPDTIEQLIKHLEKRAQEIEAPIDVKLPEAAKDTPWHCASRAAGIRDAIHSIKLAFGVKP